MSKALVIEEKRREEKGYPRIVNVTCPTCQRRQRAGVHFYVGDPFPSYGHQCDTCVHEIGESEWSEGAPGLLKEAK
ncbi:MAG: hypothetical protein PHC68_02630 [Syntrophorhabdaceae bacterium]|nr:hypothetical protein [Syntrophorhabdaceae bacterium]